MKILFLINEIKIEEDDGTTALMAHTISKRGHEVYMADIDNLIYFPDGHIGARSITVENKFRGSRKYMQALKETTERVMVTSRDLDILFLRNNPSDDLGERAWAQNAGVIFGKMAVLKGVLVLNDPDIMAHAIVDKMYFEQFPEIVRPKTIISRKVEDLMNFYYEQNERMILKPLHGSGGKDVFLIKNDAKNIEDIVATISKWGFVIAQEYLEEASEGDIRLIMVNGEPLIHKGKACAIRRVAQKEDFRSNLHAGATAVLVEMTDELRWVASIFGPKFKKDGVFLVGIDIVGKKVLEINVMSPGAMLSANEVADVNFAEPIVDALERKVQYRKLYGDQIDNATLNTMI